MRSERPHRVHRHTHLGGIGRNHLYDNYLSPLDYTGFTAGYVFLAESPIHDETARISTLKLVGLNLTSAKNPKKNGEFIDMELEAAFGCHFNRIWSNSSDGGNQNGRLRVALGGLAGLHLGGTYSSRNGNNPAQGRLAADLSFSSIAEYGFRLWQQRWLWRTQLDLPLAGVMFSPQYGQTYYEIFELGHTNHNVCLTYFGNAPSMRALSTLSLPFGRNRLSVGIHLNYRQSHLNHLKRHAWNSMFVLGYTRTFKFFD